MYDNGNGGVPAVMNVTPAGYGYGGGYGNGIFGGDTSSLILVLLLFGMFGGNWGGNGGYGGNGLYPWLNQSNQINDGFRDQMMNDTINGIHGAVTTGFGNVQTALCNGFAGVNATVNGAQNAIAQQLYTGEIAALNRSFAEQAANAQGFNGVQAGICDLRYTEATEACATRNNSTQNTQAIINAVNTGVQSIKDQIFSDKLDAKNEKIAELERRLSMADLAASQIQQTANIVDQTYNRFATCPVNTTPVYGNQRIFTCNNNGCGCGNNAGFVA